MYIHDKWRLSKSSEKYMYKTRNALKIEMFHSPNYTHLLYLHALIQRAERSIQSYMCSGFRRQIIAFFSRETNCAAIPSSIWGVSLYYCHSDGQATYFT